MKSKLQERFNELTVRLAGQIGPGGFWKGELSSSALAVAVAVAALHFHDRSGNREKILQGLKWLKNNLNNDGSFGDTPESPGNISTTLLVYAAVNLYSSEDKDFAELQLRMADYLKRNSIDITSGEVSDVILKHYKKDLTFSVPILTMCALCGIPPGDDFRNIPQLPFELSLLPRSFYRLLNLNVVSYAIPALVAVGIVISKKKKSGIILSFIRRRSISRALLVLEKMMPESGGFLEAIPLTAFVSMSLINAGYGDHEVVKRGIAFLNRTQRADGGWPIDVDLSTWVTSLGIKALRYSGIQALSDIQKQGLCRHLLAVQNKSIHPFNGTGPGGWGWTDYSGSVPDGDDTPGAMIALLQLMPEEQIREEIIKGSRWLLSLQNNDGGFPTFSRGWSKLPFDSSCADLTGHCLLAVSTVIEKYGNTVGKAELRSYHRLVRKAVSYLIRNQQADGSWLPLWFGNQHRSDHTNPVYGTARVVSYLLDVTVHERLSPDLKAEIRNMIREGRKYLLDARNEDGSWGRGKNIRGTIEETALSISALISPDHWEVCKEGFGWLDQYYRINGLLSAPIGLYFASLWYDEKMYPLTSYLEAVSRSLELMNVPGVSLT